MQVGTENSFLAGDRLRHPLNKYFRETFSLDTLVGQFGWTLLRYTAGKTMFFWDTLRAAPVRHSSETPARHSCKTLLGSLGFFLLAVFFGPIACLIFYSLWGALWRRSCKNLISPSVATPSNFAPMLKRTIQSLSISFLLLAAVPQEKAKNARQNITTQLLATQNWFSKPLEALQDTSKYRTCNSNVSPNNLHFVPPQQSNSNANCQKTHKTTPSEALRMPLKNKARLERLCKKYCTCRLPHNNN